MKTVLVCLATVAAAAASGWQHGWDTVGDMWWGDFGYSLLTQQQARFVAQNYKIVSLEKCTGRAQGMKTEAAIYQTARQLKALNPGLKVLFYWSVTQAGVGCYAANDTLADHPEWLLRDDNGAVVTPPRIDVTNEDACNWWLDVPLNGTRGAGTEVAGLIDGILADDAGYNELANVSAARSAAQYQAKHKLLQRMQARFHAANGGIVMGNGLSEYDMNPADPHNRQALAYMDAIQNEHFAVFEQINRTTGGLVLDKCADALDQIEWAAANTSKTVFASFWPGLMTSPTGPSWWNDTQPRTLQQWQAVMQRELVFPMAAFLTVAAPNVYMAYALWYELHQGFVPCPEAPDSCACPPDFYPSLKKKLGEPLSARRKVGQYQWRRDFTHATVFLDLVTPTNSSITWNA